jgi:DNA repair exonuclease SbcCD ATPase subunit
MEPYSDRCPLCGSPLSHERFLKVTEHIRERERKRLQEQQQAANHEVEKKILQATAKSTEELKRIAKQRDDALLKVKTAEEHQAAQAKKLLLKAEEQHQKELARQRDLLAKETDVQQLKLQAQHKREREYLQKQIFELNRKVQQKTANELGDGAELDLYEILRNAFPYDKISRIRKGEEGADILQEVVY